MMTDMQKSEIRETVMTALAFHPYSPQQTLPAIMRAVETAYLMGKMAAFDEVRDIHNGARLPETTGEGAKR